MSNRPFQQTAGTITSSCVIYVGSASPRPDVDGLPIEPVKIILADMEAAKMILFEEHQ